MRKRRHQSPVAASGGRVPSRAASGGPAGLPGANSASRLAVRVWPYALLIAVAVVFCGRAVFTGRALAPLDMLLLMPPWKAYADGFGEFVRVQTPMLDPVQAYFPWRIFAVDALKQGILPLWNPYAFAGTPFVANVQSAVLYPPNLLFLLMPAAFAFTWSAALHLALAGCFMFFFLRVWGIGVWAALAAGAAYMLNGYFAAWLAYPSLGLWVAVWLPLALALFELSLRRRSWALTAGAGVVLGVQFLGGHVQVSAYIMLALLLYAAVRTLWPATREDQPPIRRWEPAVRGLAAFALGALLGAGQLLPALELAPLSHRPAVGPGAASSTALPLTHLVIYFVPKFFGSLADHNYWGNLVGRPDINFQETSGHVGVLTLLLAGLGVLEWRRPLSKYLVILAALSLLMALGTPLYLVLYYAVPGFKQMAGVARIMYLTAFGLTALAGVGLDRLLRRRELDAPGRVVTVLFLGAALAVVMADVYIFRVEIATLVETLGGFSGYFSTQLGLFAVLVTLSVVIVSVRRVVSSPALGSVCAAVIAADLFIAWFTFNPATDPRLAYFETATTRYLQQQAPQTRMLSVGANFLNWMPPNTPTAYALRDIQGSDSLWWGRYFEFLTAVQPRAPTYEWDNLDAPGLDLLAVAHIVAGRPLSAPGWELVLEEDAFVYRRTNLPVRAALFADWRIASPRAALDAVAAGEREVLTRPLLDADPGIAAQPGSAAGSARIAFDGVNAITVETQAPGPRVLVLADPAYPGWRAEVDGLPARQVTANYIFRAVTVPAGGHEVTWRYQPTAFRLGLFGGLIGVALTAGVLGAVLGRRRRRRE